MYSLSQCSSQNWWKYVVNFTTFCSLDLARIRILGWFCFDEFAWIWLRFYMYRDQTFTNLISSSVWGTTVTRLCARTTSHLRNEIALLSLDSGARNWRNRTAPFSKSSRCALIPRAVAAAVFGCAALINPCRTMRRISSEKLVKS